MTAAVPFVIVHPEFGEIYLMQEIFPPPAEARPTRRSRKSQESQATHAAHNLDPVEIDLFEERAAIMEYDGGLDRQAAEARALLAVLAGRSV